MCSSQVQSGYSQSVHVDLQPSFRTRPPPCWLPFVLSHSYPQTELMKWQRRTLAGRALAILLGETQTHVAQADPPTAKRTKCRDANQYVSRTRGECTSSLKMCAALQYGIGVQLSCCPRLPVAQAQTPPIKFGLLQRCPQAPSPTWLFL